MATDEILTPTRRRLRRALVAGAGAAALLVAGLGVASAQTGSTTTTTASTPTTTGPGQGGGGGGHKMKFRGGPGFGFGGSAGAIHSESTLKSPDGTGYRTVAAQVGEVLSVSNSAIEVKSEDGYTREYKVDEDTLVNAGRDGIADVKDGDKVHVTAFVAGGTASAKRVSDLTNLERFGQQWGKRPR